MTDLDEPNYVPRESIDWEATAEMWRSRAESAEAEADRMEASATDWQGRAIEATEERDALQARVNEALAVTMFGSVPLGVTEARHYDRLLAEVRRALSTPSKEES